jgi:pyruvate kinase
MLRKMIAAGADVFRLNMSHARHDWCHQVVDHIREASKEIGRTVGILFDLQGPSIRTGDVEGKITLEKGDRVEFRKEGTEARLEKSTTVNYGGLMTDVSEGDDLTVDNGELLMKIERLEEDRMICEVLTAGAMGSRRHINLPGVRLSLPALTEKDHADIKVAAACKADFVAGSFVRDAGHVRELRATLVANHCDAQIVSKLEDQEAMRHLDDIIQESDVIMVARGDLGIEVHVEELPIIQRRIVKRCHQLGRRVIVATHMLESMIQNPTPTRAEVTDVSNAVYEEADAIMLSGETTVGEYPVRCVELMDRGSGFGGLDREVPFGGLYAIRDDRAPGRSTPSKNSHLRLYAGSLGLFKADPFARSEIVRGSLSRDAARNDRGSGETPPPRT